MRADRLNEMEQYILGRENVSLEELCVQFSISMNTVRRDIAELLNRGNVRKVYGKTARQSKSLANWRRGW